MDHKLVWSMFFNEIYKHFLNLRHLYINLKTVNVTLVLNVLKKILIKKLKQLFC